MVGWNEPYPDLGKEYAFMTLLLDVTATVSPMANARPLRSTCSCSSDVIILVAGVVVASAKKEEWREVAMSCDDAADDVACGGDDANASTRFAQWSIHSDTLAREIIADGLPTIVFRVFRSGEERF